MAELSEPVSFVLSAIDSYRKNCGENAVQCAEEDLLGQALEALKAAIAYDLEIQAHAYKGEPWTESDQLDKLYSDWIDKSRAVLAKAKGA